MDLVHLEFNKIIFHLPVILMVYNLPCCLCMTCPFYFLTLLIPSPNSPSQNIDVYLRPLVDDLKLLWEEGVYTWDALLRQNSKCGLLYYGLSVTSLHMACYLDGAHMGNWRVHIAWAKWNLFEYSRKATCFDCHSRYLRLSHQFKWYCKTCTSDLVFCMSVGSSIK